MQPTLTDVHINAPLTNISVAYIQNQANFIATKVFPIVPVDKKSDVFFKYTKNDWFRDEAKLRAPGTESAGSGYGLSTDSYDCDVFALHKDIDDQIRANADAVINPDREATEFLTQRMLVREEVQWVADFFSTSIWGTDASPGSNMGAIWSDFTNSDPLDDVDNAKQVVLTNTGLEVNTLVLGYPVYRKLIRHPDFRDQIKYTSPENINPDLLAKIFDIERVLVAKAVYATNNEGGTAAMAFTHGKNALACHVANAPGLLTPSAGYTFGWRGVSAGMLTPIGVRQFRMEHLKSDRVEAEVAFDNHVVASDLGFFFSGAVS